MKIRNVDDSDAVAIAAIYEHYVRTTAFSFELVPPSVEEIAKRIDDITRSHP